MADNDKIRCLSGVNHRDPFDQEEFDKILIVDVVKKNFFRTPLDLVAEKTGQEFHDCIDYLLGNTMLDFKFVVGVNAAIVFRFLY